MQQLYRICKARYADSAFSGEGARLYAGRWNHQGVPMVYTSSSLALAAMELFVHLNPTEAPDDLVFTAATLASGTKIETIQTSQLPADWRRIDHPALRDLGGNWVREKRTVALRVPSAVVPEEWNVLLNPAHPSFSRVAIGVSRPFRYDQRMFR